MKLTQAERVLDYMEQHGGITQFEALAECAVMRLASRISDLRKQGWAIESVMVTVKNRFDEDCRVKRYYLENWGEDNAVD